jgi:hypothetical protein
MSAIGSPAEGGSESPAERSSKLGAQEGEEATFTLHSRFAFHTAARASNKSSGQWICLRSAHLPKGALISERREEKRPHERLHPQPQPLT